MPDKYKIMHPIFVFAKQNYDNYFLPVNEQLAKKTQQSLCGWKTLSSGRLIKGGLVSSA